MARRAYAPLLVQPDVLAPADVVDGILVGDPVLHVGPVDPVLLAPAQDGPRAVGLKLAVDLVHQGQPLLWVGRLRLLDHEPVDLLRAIAREIALGPATIVLEELGVRIVDPSAG